MTSDKVDQLLQFNEFSIHFGHNKNIKTINNHWEHKPEKGTQKNQNSSFNVIATSHYKGPSAFATPTLKTTALEHLHAIESERGQNLPVSREKCLLRSLFLLIHSRSRSNDDVVYT